MGNWSGNKVDQNYINNGNEYEQGDRVSREQLNAMVNSGLYVQDFIEDLTKEVEVENPNPNLDPEVEIIDSPNASPEKPYKRLKLKNFKGRKGDKGDVGNGWYLPIGTIVSTAIYSDNPALHLLDGSSLLKTGVYEEFCTWVENRISSDPSAVPTCTIDEYASDMATYGQCGKFVINNAEYDLATDGYVVRANSIKLPTITEFIASNNGGDAIGLAELDEFKSHTHGTMMSYVSAQSGNSVGVSWINYNGGEANTYSTGGEETRPKNIRYPYYIVVATGTKADIEIDLNNVANDINAINHSINKLNNKFYFSQQYYGGDSPQAIYGPATEKLWAFGNITIDFPRAGIYEITTYVYCYSGNGGDSQYYITVDGVKTGPSAIIMGANTYIMHPLVVYATISAGTHTISLYGNQWKEGRTFNMSPYNQNQITIKEL